MYCSFFSLSVLSHTQVWDVDQRTAEDMLIEETSIVELLFYHVSVVVVIK